MDYWGQYLTSRARTTAPGSRLRGAVEAARALHPAESNVHPIVEPPVVSISPRPVVDESTAPDEDFGLGARWGARWDESAQGWIGPEGTWRPIITTTSDFDDWSIETYLGLVSGEASARIDVVESALGGVLEEARQVATASLIDNAITRGAHAVVGCELHYTPLDHRMLVTVTGTAVTLKEG